MAGRWTRIRSRALPDGASVGDALDRLGELTRGVRVVMAVNREYADAAAPLQAGDEVALIPPVSGGSVTALHVRITNEPLSRDRSVVKLSVIPSAK